MVDDSDMRKDLRTEIKALADGIEEEWIRHDGEISVHDTLHETVDSSPWVYNTSVSYETVQQLRVDPMYVDEHQPTDISHHERLNDAITSVAYDFIEHEVTALLRQRDNGIDV